MGRNHEIRIKLSKEEYEAVKKKSQKTGMPISSLVRFLLLNSNISVSLSE